MIQIDRHIEILLLDNDCVIVPGLGGFMTHHVCARYCTDTQTFLPPLRQLGFNAQLKINDSLLAQSYIEAYDISYPEAIRRIEDEVSELRQMLQNEGFCELNDIGVLRLNIEGNIEFEPCESGILTPELYGLNVVDIVPLKDENQSVTRDKVSNSGSHSGDILVGMYNESPKASPELVVSAGSAKDGEEDKADEITSETKTPATISIKVSTLKHIATVAAIILALFICALPFGKMVQPQLSQSQIDTGILYNIIPDKVHSNDAGAKVMKFKQANPVVNDTASKDSSKMVAVAPASPEADKHSIEKAVEPVNKAFFGIVLASRVSRVNAQAFVDRLQKAGYKEGRVVGRPNGSLKVVYGQYTSENEAKTQLCKLRDVSDQFAEGWVMEFN